ncbi:MAG TPA: hypothetical protein VF079_08310 [Sphingomicrobium sp.]
MRIVITLVCAASLASSASAQVTSFGTANPAPKGGKQDLNRIVCEVDETTGTRLGARKICKTVLEWHQLKNDTQQGVQKVQQQATSTGIPSG